MGRSIRRDAEPMTRLFSIDTHAGGEPCRVLYSGAPVLQGGDLGEKRATFQAEYDWIREALMLEPRGHSGMFGAIIVPPCRPENQFGLIFFDPTGYMDGCGHATLCSVAVYRRVSPEIESPFHIENPDGSVTTVLTTEGNSEYATSALQLPPVEVVADHLSLGGSNATLAHVRCGNDYLIVSADEMAFDLTRAGVAQLRSFAHELRLRLARFDGSLDRLEVMLYTKLDTGRYRTAVVFNGTQVDRSPCGTGSSALVSLLVHRDLIQPGESVETIGLSGEAFRVVARRGLTGSCFESVLSGEAFVTGKNEWVISARDPLRHGYRLEE